MVSPHILLFNIYYIIPTANVPLTIETIFYHPIKKYLKARQFMNAKDITINGLDEHKKFLICPTRQLKVVAPLLLSQLNIRALYPYRKTIQ